MNYGRLIMRYENADFGFAFELPDDWRVDPSIRPLTFFGPNGRIGSTSEVIQLHLGGIQPQYHDPGNREKFLAEPGAEVIRSRAGDETNVVVLRKPSNSEISVVRDGIQYSITYPNDAATERVIERLKESFRFPSGEEAAATIKNSADPTKQLTARLLMVGSTEEAHRVLREWGVPPVAQGSGFTKYVVPDASANPVSRKREVAKRNGGSSGNVGARHGRPRLAPRANSAPSRASA
jgi:hypothetical protein